MMKTLHIAVKLQSPLHISSERGQETGSRRPFVKTIDGLPYIPASTIKGCLRHETERLLRTQQIAICNAPSAERMCQSDRPCPVCQLFGSPWHSSNLFFNDLALVDAKIFTQLRHARVPSPTVRPGVRLNRKRRTAEDGLFFEKELFEPGHPWEFAGQIIYEGDDNNALAIVYMAARSTNMLGTARSRGLGWNQITLTEANVTMTLAVLEKMWTDWSKTLPRAREG